MCVVSALGVKNSPLKPVSPQKALYQQRHSSLEGKCAHKTHTHIHTHTHTIAYTNTLHTLPVCVCVCVCVSLKPGQKVLTQQHGPSWHCVLIERVDQPLFGVDQYTIPVNREKTSSQNDYNSRSIKSKYSLVQV